MPFDRSEASVEAGDVSANSGETAVHFGRQSVDASIDTIQPSIGRVDPRAQSCVAIVNLAPQRCGLLPNLTPDVAEAVPNPGGAEGRKGEQSDDHRGHQPEHAPREGAHLPMVTRIRGGVTSVAAGCGWCAK